MKKSTNNLEPTRKLSENLIHDKSVALDKWKRLNYGMFIHLGLYSELGGVWEGKPVKKGYSEQIQMWADIPREQYESIASTFHLEEFDPKEVVKLAKDAGMNYIVLTTKHHDGFCLFDTETTDFNTVKATPFNDDVVKLISDECQKQGMKFGMYYSLVDWHQGHEFDFNNNNTIPPSIELIIEKQLTELMTNYGEICEVWFDMGHPTLEQSMKFSEIVRKFQPNAAINGRIWNNLGDFRTLDDNQVPLDLLEGAWQTPASIYNETWGYRQWQERTNSTGKLKELIGNLIAVRARGGNYLLNIGPKGDGSLVPFEKNLLKEIGKWLKINQSAVIGNTSLETPSFDWGELTLNQNTLYCHILEWPEDNKLVLNKIDADVQSVELTETKEKLDWEIINEQLVIKLPETLSSKLVPVVAVHLNKEVTVISENVVSKSNNMWHISQDKMIKKYAYCDKGNYSTLEKNLVSLSFYITDKETESVRVEFNGNASDNEFYSIKIDDQESVVDGKTLMEKGAGNFLLSKDEQVSKVTINLSDPSPACKQLDLDSISIGIKQASQTN